MTEEDKFVAEEDEDYQQNTWVSTVHLHKQYSPINIFYPILMLSIYVTDGFHKKVSN